MSETGGEGDRRSARSRNGTVYRRRWRATPGQGDVAIGGATLAAEASALGLVDEYRLRVHHMIVSGGTPFFPRAERRENLGLVDSRTFESGVVHLRYRVSQ